MPKQTKGGAAKGSRKKEAAFVRNATQHTNFVGGADDARAEAEVVKKEHLEAARTKDIVREMTNKLEEVAGIVPPAPANGFHAPRSIADAKAMLSEAPVQLEALRAKARERLASLPKPVVAAVNRAESLACMLLAPVRAGFRLASDVLRIPGALLRSISRREV